MLGQPYMLGAQRFPSPACGNLLPASVLFQDNWTYAAGSQVLTAANPVAWPINSKSGNFAAVTFDGAGHVVAGSNGAVELLSKQITFNGDKPHMLKLSAPVLTTGSVNLEFERQAGPIVYGYGVNVGQGGVTGQQVLLYENGVQKTSAPIPAANQGGDIILAAGQWNGASRLILVSVGGVVVVTYTGTLQAAGINNQAIDVIWSAGCSSAGISFSGYAT